jgi:hypothetical protein
MYESICLLCQHVLAPTTTSRQMEASAIKPLFGGDTEGVAKVQIKSCCYILFSWPHLCSGVPGPLEARVNMPDTPHRLYFNTLSNVSTGMMNGINTSAVCIGYMR